MVVNVSNILYSENNRAKKLRRDNSPSESLRREKDDLLNAFGVEQSHALKTTAKTVVLQITDDSASQNFKILFRKYFWEKSRYSGNQLNINIRLKSRLQYSLFFSSVGNRNAVNSSRVLISNLFAFFKITFTLCRQNNSLFFSCFCFEASTEQLEYGIMQNIIQAIKLPIYSRNNKFTL